MATRIIKLQNDSYTLLPVTDAKLVQMTVDGNTKSIYDVILEDEEVTAAGYNELNDRVETLETAGYITNAALSSYVKGLNSTVGTGVVTGATLEDNSSGGKNIKLTYTSLSTSDPSASGNSSTFIATISQAANGKITATKKTVTIPTPTIKHELRMQDSSTVYPLIAYDNGAIGTNASNWGTKNIDTVVTPMADGSESTDPAVYVKDGKLHATDGFVTRNISIDGMETTIDVGNDGNGTIKSYEYIIKAPSAILNHEEEDVSLSDVLTEIQLSIPENTDENVKITGKNSNTNYPLVLRTNTSNISNGSTETTGLVTDTESGAAYYNPSLNKFYAQKTYTDILTVPTTSSAADKTKGINFYDGSNIVSHIGASFSLGLYTSGSVYIRPNNANESSPNGSVIINNSGTTVSQYVTATGFKTPSGTSSQLLKANGATISYTTTPPSSSSTDNEIPTSKAVWSSIGTALTSVLKYKGTLGTGGTITSLPSPIAAYLGYVYVVKTAGNYANVDVDINGTNEATSGNNAYMSHLEPGDYVIGTWNGSAYVWSAINGENQITNYGPASTTNGTAIIPASGSGNVRIANVDGTDITLSYSHGAPTADANSKLSKDASGGSAIAANTATQIVTGVDISRDANGHVTGLDLDSKSITIPSIPNGFANVKTDSDETDITENTTKGTVAADSTTDTVTLRGGNKWITTGVNTTSDIAYVNHKTWKTADGSIVANASGATAAWSIDVVKGVTLSYDAAGHVGGLTVTSGKIPDPASTLYWANMNVQTAANYIKEPEFKTVKINGSSTNAASTYNCVLQYDTTNKCLNFVFN